MSDDRALRAHLARILDWEDAHVGFDRAIAGLPAPLRGVTPPGCEHSAWQLLEHIRIAQRDILDFCVNPKDVELASMDDLWPPSAKPPSSRAWTASVAAVRRERAAMRTLATDGKVDLFARIPHGSGQTYLREILLVADHGAYHVGQLVALRRALGAWKG
jgi:uncharacterized damage-inducible protein DinB